MASERPSYTPTLTPLSLSDIPAQTRNGGESLAVKTINEFLASGAEAAEVGDASKSFSSSLKRAIKAGIPGVVAFKRGERTILKRVGAGNTEDDDS